MTDDSALDLDTPLDAVDEAHDRGELGVGDDTPIEPQPEAGDHPADGTEVDWADVWTTAGLEGGAGTMSMTQLTLAVDVAGATASHDRERAATLVAEAVEAGLLADVGSVSGTEFALAGGRR